MDCGWSNLSRTYHRDTRWAVEGVKIVHQDGYEVIHPNVIGHITTFAHSDTDWYELLGNAFRLMSDTLRSRVLDGLRLFWRYADRRGRERTLRSSPRKDQEFFELLLAGDVESFELITDLAEDFGSVGDYR